MATASVCNTFDLTFRAATPYIGTVTIKGLSRSFRVTEVLITGKDGTDLAIRRGTAGGALLSTVSISGADAWNVQAELDEAAIGFNADQNIVMIITGSSGDGITKAIFRCEARDAQDVDVTLS